MNNQVKRNYSQMSKPIVIREQIPAALNVSRTSSSSKNSKPIQEDSMEYDTINSRSIKGYKF